MKPRPPRSKGAGFSFLAAGTRLVLGLFLVAAARAQTPGIPEAETAFAPTPARLSVVHAAALRDGWAPQRAGLRAAALRAYEREKFAAAEAWLNLYRWSALFGEPQSEFVARWLEAVQTAQVGHANMAPTYEATAAPLGAGVSRELQAWLIGNAKFSAEFFGVVSPVDYLPKTLEILNDLFRREPLRFKTYASLALALAVVYDVPPPPFFPHGQVTAEALPRVFPPAASAFSWWLKQEETGRTYQHLSRLGAEELKFVIDVSAPLAELEWSQGGVNLPLSQLARAYNLVRYRRDRVANDRPIWPGSAYQLPEILKQGGICSDQAYFATQVGKARGVPTILIYGAGNDGRHAWFGYLDGNQAWQLDAGRYAEQRFVTGYARDPQTWAQFTDHDLQFLSERFRMLPSYRQSVVHQLFAAEYLAGGNVAAAGVAARKSVSFERRNEKAWESLLAAARREGRDARTIESLLREAALAFQRYPDLEARYAKRVAESLRARGETSAAAAELRRISLKHKGERGDIGVEQARELLTRAIATQPLAGQIQTYNSAVDFHGPGAGMGFFDQIVAPFVEHLLGLNQKAEALRAVARAKRTLQAPPNTQLATELDGLTAKVHGAR